MKVAFVAPFNLNVYDGTTIRVLNLANAALYTCEMVYLVSPSISNELKSARLVHVRMRELKPKHHFLLAYLSECSKRFPIEIVTRILHIDYDGLKDVDVIHVHWLLFKYSSTLPKRFFRRLANGCPWWWICTAPGASSPPRRAGVPLPWRHELRQGVQRADQGP